MPKIELEVDPADQPHWISAAFRQAPVQGRWYRRLAPASGLTDFGVSHVTC